MRRRIVPGARLAIAFSWLGSAVGCASSSSEATMDAAAPVSACAAAGGLCGVSACSALGPQSCGAAGGTCCLDGLSADCLAEAGSHPIVASSYDQSCDVDSDCVAIGVGDPCEPCEVLCAGSAAIRSGALAQYMADVAKSPAGKGTFVCECPQYSPASVCCNAGVCAPYCLDLSDASADAAAMIDAPFGAAGDGGTDSGGP